MSERYKIGDSQIPHFITFTIIDWVDLLTRPLYKEIIVDSFNYCINHKGLIIHAYCIMPSHVHTIISSKENDLNNIIRDMKKFTSKALIKAIQVNNESRRQWLLKKFSYAAKRIKRGANYKVWQDGFHPIELNSNQLQVQKLEYIHANPVVEGYVFKESDWAYSSASYYSGFEELQLVALQMLN